MADSDSHSEHGVPMVYETVGVEAVAEEHGGWIGNTLTPDSDSGVPPKCWTLGLCGRVMVVVVLPFVWWLLSDRGVKPAGVVPGFDPPSDR